MKENKQQGFGTQCIHAGFTPEAHRSHITPIYASSTYLFDSAEYAVDLFTGKQEGYIYGRFGNPTITQCEEKIAALEAYELFNEDGTPLKLKAILIYAIVIGNVAEKRKTYSLPFEIKYRKG